MKTPALPVEQQPNPPVEKQSNPSPDMQPRKAQDVDFEREGKFQRPAGPGTVGPGKSSAG